MTNVVQFPAQNQGNLAFMQCSCGPESYLMPIVMADHNSALIVAVVCPECESQHDVVNGIIQHGDDS